MRNVSVEQSVNLLIQHVSRTKESERVQILDAVGRIAAEDIFAHVSQPPFNRSPLDGYAVRHDDIRNSSPDSPATLRVTQHVYAGALPGVALGVGEAAHVATGAPLPPGATCVVRQEDTGGGKTTVRVFSAVGEYENYCRKGEDVKEGKLLVQRGQCLSCAHIAVLAGQGYAELEVYARPEIGILSTGSELFSVGQPLLPGKIYDSNSYYLASRVKQMGGKALLSPSVDDDPEKLFLTFLDLLSVSDMLITTGGVSVGVHDYMSAAGKRLGARELFHGVDMKPGSPAMALYKDDKLILCLSGNPFAAVVSFEMLAAPAIRKLSGRGAIHPKRINGILRGEFAKKNPIRRFIRGRAEAGEVYLLRGGDSPGMLSSLVECNCLVDVPAHSSPLREGDPVEAVLLQTYPPEM